MAAYALNTDLALDLCYSCTHVLAVGADPTDVGMSEGEADRIIALTANLHVYGPVIGAEDTEIDHWGACDTCGLHGGRYVVPADYR